MIPPRIAAVVLAAGAASRFGAPKQLATFLGEPLVLRAVRHATEAGASPVIVVLGAYAAAIAPLITGLDGVIVVTNDRWAGGVASSLQIGIGVAAAAPIDAVLVTSLDQPLVDADALARLIDALSPEHRLVAAEYNGVIGVPALIGTELLDDLARNVSGDRGAAAWLRAQQSVVRIPIPRAALDADTPAALDAMERAELVDSVLRS
jgi:molybdenum cofactor cytidylyltransferase